MEGAEDVSRDVTGHIVVTQLYYGGGVDGAAKKSFGPRPQGAKVSFPEENQSIDCFLPFRGLVIV